MPLSEEEARTIREEETLRHEIRQSLAGPKPPSGMLERLSAFFETKAGFWILTTVLAGTFATGYSEVQRYLNRDTLARTAKAEQARRDMDSVMKLGPLLTSNEVTQITIATVLLDRLREQDAIDPNIAGTIKTLIVKTSQVGAGPGASASDQLRTNVILSVIDSSRTSEIQGGVSNSTSGSTSNSAKGSDALTLPPRVYLQFSDAKDRQLASTAAGELRKAGIIVPGIELVPARSAPSANDIRYCAGQVDQVALQRVVDAAKAAITPTPKTLVLNPSQCGNVRFNHFEVWLAATRSP